MQKKLEEAEAANCRKIAAKLGSAFDFDATDEGKGYWQGVVESLCKKWKHGTSDGKPLVEPEPEIPEGYRKANADEWKRTDVKFWHKDCKEWKERLPCLQGTAFDPPGSGTIYIVPIDQPLTDRDACVVPRLLVMGRDSMSDPWEGPLEYHGVSPNSEYPFTTNDPASGERWVFRYARRATPAEIEAAKSSG